MEQYVSMLVQTYIREMQASNSPSEWIRFARGYLMNTDNKTLTIDALAKYEATKRIIDKIDSGALSFSDTEHVDSETRGSRLDLSGYGDVVRDGASSADADVWEKRVSTELVPVPFSRMNFEALNSGRELGECRPPFPPNTPFYFGIKLPTSVGFGYLQHTRSSGLEKESRLVTDSLGDRFADPTIAFVRFPSNFLHGTVPIPVGAEVVACGDGGDVRIVEQAPITYLIDKVDDPTFFITTSPDSPPLTVNNVQQYLPSPEERAYWKEHFPLPPELLSSVQTEPDRVLEILKSFFAKHFYYVCHDGIGEFLEDNVKDLPLLMSELEMGHCEYLSWVASAYLRQMNIPALVMEEQTTSAKGTGFRMVGHTKLAIPGIGGQVDIFDPTTYARSSSKLDPGIFSESAIRRLRRDYANAETEEEKRNVLREFRDTVDTVVDVRDSEIQWPYDDLLRTMKQLVVLRSRDIGGGNSDSLALDKISLPSDFAGVPTESSTPHRLLHSVRERQLFFELSRGLSERGIHMLSNDFEGEDIATFLECAAGLKDGTATVRDNYEQVQYAQPMSESFVQGVSCWSRQLEDILPLREPFSSYASFKKYFDEYWDAYILAESQSDPRLPWGIIGHANHEIVCKHEGIIGDDMTFDPPFVDFVRRCIQDADSITIEFKALIERIVLYFNIDLSYDLDSADITDRYDETTEKDMFDFTFQYIFFYQLCARSLQKKSVRERIEKEFGITPEQWKRFAEDLEPRIQGKALQDEKPLRSALGVDGSILFTKEEYRKTFQTDKKRYAASKRSIMQLLNRRTSDTSKVSKKNIGYEVSPYNPDIHEPRQIAWSTSARAGETVARSYESERVPGTPLYVYIDYVNDRISSPTQQYEQYTVLFDAILTMSKKQNVPVYISGPHITRYMKLDKREHARDVAYSYLKYMSICDEAINPTAPEGVPSFRVDVPDRSTGHGIIPVTKKGKAGKVIYFSGDVGKTSAVQYAFSKNEVTVVPFSEIGLHELGPQLRDDWVGK
jgi:hypothetical protein